MSEKKLLIPRNDGGNLKAVHFFTKNLVFKKGDKKSPLVILCHGFTGDKYENGRYPKTARALNEAGFDTLIFDFSGSGENERELVLLSKQVKDLESVYRWAEKQYYSWIALVGLSFGGLTTFVTNLPSVKAIVLWAPVLYPTRVFEDEKLNLFLAIKSLRKRPLKLPSISEKGPILVDKSFADDLSRYDLIFRLKSFTIPTLIVQGTTDTVVKLIDTREAFSYFPRNKLHKLIEIPNATHEFDGVQLDEFIKQTIDWLKKYV